MASVVWHTCSARWSNVGWLSLTWAMNTAPASSKLFLTAHGIDGLQSLLEPELVQQSLDRRDFVGLLRFEALPRNISDIGPPAARATQRTWCRPAATRAPRPSTSATTRCRGIGGRACRSRTPGARGRPRRDARGNVVKSAPRRVWLSVWRTLGGVVLHFFEQTGQLGASLHRVE